jgi:hypothetical protein
VTRGDHRASQKLLLRDAARLRVRAADERVGLVDGAPCLKVQMDKLPLSKVGDPPVHAVGLDFYHLGEHVHEARRLTFGPDSEPVNFSRDFLRRWRYNGRHERAGTP